MGLILFFILAAAAALLIRWIRTQRAANKPWPFPQGPKP